MFVVFYSRGLTARSLCHLHPPHRKARLLNRSAKCLFRSYGWHLANRFFGSRYTVHATKVGTPHHIHVRRRQILNAQVASGLDGLAMERFNETTSSGVGITRSPASRFGLEHHFF